MAFNVFGDIYNLLKNKNKDDNTKHIVNNTRRYTSEQLDDKISDIRNRAQATSTKPEWTAAIVDNSSVSSGIKTTDYGYQLAHCEDAKDGEFVLVNSKGEVKLIEQGDMSEDEQGSVIEFKKNFAFAKDTYATNFNAMQYAKAGDSLVNADTDNPHQVNSAIDLVTTLGSAVLSSAKTLFDESSKELQLQSEAGWRDVEDAVSSLTYRTASGKAIYNDLLKHRFGTNWRETLINDPKRMQEAFDSYDDDNVFERRQKEYMAYQLMTGINPNNVQTSLINTLTSFGETMDWAANAVKPIVMKAGDSVDWLPDVSKEDDYSDVSLGEMIKRGYQSPYSKEGRIAYNYDTGNGAMNFLLEVVSDPGNLVSMGSSALARSAAKDAVAETTEQAVKQFANSDYLAKVATESIDATAKSSKSIIRDAINPNIADTFTKMATDTMDETATKQAQRVLRNFVRNGVRSGKTNEQIAMDFARNTVVPPQHLDEFTNIVTRALDYGRDMKILRSLNVAQKFFDKGDDVAKVFTRLTTPLGPAALVKRNLVKGYKILDGLHWVNKTEEYMPSNEADELSDSVDELLSDEADDIVKKEFVDAVTSATGKPLGEEGFGVHQVSDVVDWFNTYSIGDFITGNKTSRDLLGVKALYNLSLAKHAELCTELENMLSDTTLSFSKSLDKVYVRLEQYSSGTFNSLDDYSKWIRNYCDVHKLPSDEFIKRLQALQVVYTRERNASTVNQIQIIRDASDIFAEKSSRLLRLEDEGYAIEDVLRVNGIHNMYNKMAKDILRALERPSMVGVLGEDLVKDLSKRAKPGNILEAMRTISRVRDALDDAVLLRLPEYYLSSIDATQTARKEFMERTVDTSPINPVEVKTEAHEVFGDKIVRNPKKLDELGERSYVLQLSKRASGNIVANDTELIANLEHLVNPSEKCGAEFIARLSENNLQGGVFRNTYAAVQGVQRYLRITSTITNSSSIPKELKEGLIDAMYTKGNLLSNLPDLKDSPYDTALHGKYAAKSLIDSALRFTVQTDADLCDRFARFECNSADTKANVDNMAKVLKNELGYEFDRMEYPVMYSVNMYGTSGAVTDITFKFPNSKSVTLTNNPLASVEKQRKFIKSINALLDEHKFSASKKHKTLKYYGFNTSVTGDDTLAHLKRYFTNYSNEPIIFDDVDIADLLRQQKGMPIIPHEAYDELADVFTREYDDWALEARVKKLKTKPKFTPDIDSKIMYQMDSLGIGSEVSEEIGIRLKSIAARLKIDYGYIGDINKSLHEMGIIAASNSGNLMPALRALSINSSGIVVTMKRIANNNFRRKIIAISDEFADNIDIRVITELYDFSNNVQNTLNALENYQLVESLSIPDSVFNELASYSGRLYELLSSTGSSFNSRLSNAEKLAILYNIGKNYNTAEFRAMSETLVVGLSSTDVHLKDMLKNFNEVFLNRSGNIANNARTLKGVMVNPDSRINRADSELFNVQKAYDTVSKRLDYFEALDYSLKANGCNGVLNVAHLEYQKKYSTRFRKAVTNIQDVIYTNKVKYENGLKKFLKANGDNALNRQLYAKKHSSAMDMFNKTVREFSAKRDATRFAYVSTFNDEQLFGHFVKECCGRMIIDTNYNLGGLQKTLDFVEHLNNLDEHIKVKSDNGVFSIWYDRTGISDEELLEMFDGLKDFSLPKMENYVDASYELRRYFTPPDKDNSAEESIQALLKEVDTVVPSSYTYGMYSTLQPQTVKYMDSKYFEDAEGLIADEYLSDLGVFNGSLANCIYHGPITELSKNSQSYLSNNLLTNASITFSEAMNAADNDGNILEFIHSGAYSFKKTLTIAGLTDSVQTPDQLAKLIKDNGYVVSIMRTNKKTGFYEVKQLDLTIPDMMELAMNDVGVAVVRGDEFTQLEKIARREAYSVATPSKIEKLISAYDQRIRPLYIMSMLFQKSMTFVRNAIDSPLKAVIKEGGSYFKYLAYGFKLKPLYDDATRAIMTQSGRIDMAAIDKYFAEPRDISKHMFCSLRDYFANPRSGTLVEDTLRIFVEDPALALKAYAETGLSDAELKQAVKMFEETDAKGLGTKQAMRELRKQFMEIYDPATASRVVGLYERYRQLIEQSESQLTPASIPLVGKLYSFNAGMFSNIETYSRLAIFLQRLESGDNPAQALDAIGATQFDYTKTSFMHGLEEVAPFSTFKLYNIGYWLDSAWEYKHFASVAGGLSSVLAEQSAENEGYDEFSEEAISQKLMILSIIQQHKEDTDEQYESELTFKTWDEYLGYMREYRGTTGADATSFGWLKISDKLYFKAGLSMIDAFDAASSFIDPASFFKDMLFSPLKSLADMVTDANANDYTISEFVLNHQYELTSVIPVLGSLYYSLYSSARNLVSGKDILTVLLPSGLGSVRDKTDMKTPYVDRPVGFDWYNQTQEYRDAHKYVVGVSYIPAFMKHDPATFVDTYGRLQQLGFTQSQIHQLFETGGTWWFSDTGNGYKLNNYQLQIKDEATWSAVRKRLSEYGWTDSAIDTLMSEAATPSWTSKNSSVAGYHGYGSYSSSSPAIRNAVTTARYKSSKNVGKPRKPSTAHLSYITRTGDNRVVRMNRRGVSTAGSSGTRGTHNTNYQWRRRTENIYKHNYAKYGASRMAMRQNLRNYSNRSVTELHRNDMKFEYARIHNRWWR